MELLVALGILGILFVAIISMTGSTIRFARVTSSVNDASADLSDAMGYIGLKARGAHQYLGGSTSIEISAAGYTTFTCSDSGAEPCFALVSPIVDRASADAAILGYELLAYRLTPLSAWLENPGLQPGWNGDATPLLLEFRAPLTCGTPCMGSPIVPASVTADRISLVIADLTVEGGAGSFAPFSVTGNSLTLQLRRRGHGQELDRYVPSDGPLTQVVTRRQ